jgi:hypothetical protein
LFGVFREVVGVQHPTYAGSGIQIAENFYLLRAWVNRRAAIHGYQIFNTAFTDPLQRTGSGMLRSCIGGKGGLW